MWEPSERSRGRYRGPCQCQGQDERHGHSQGRGQGQRHNGDQGHCQTQRQVTVEGTVNVKVDPNVKGTGNGRKEGREGGRKERKKIEKELAAPRESSAPVYVRTRTRKRGMEAGVSPWQQRGLTYPVLHLFCASRRRQQPRVFRG